MTNKALSVVILAAGKGTRMYSDLPKVLHKVAGKPMVKHVIDTANQLGAENVHLIYGHGGELMRERLVNESVNWVFQAEQLGTAHAVQQAAPFFKDDENIVILYGDAPLVTKETLEKLIAAKPENGIALLTVNLDNPTGYGRIIRENGNVVAIVEQKDANAEQLKIQEVNTGVLVADGAHFKNWLSRVKNNNAQGEFYLTDVIGLANQDGCQVTAVQASEFMEVEGANNRLQLAALERFYQRKQAEKLLLAGVMLIDPERFDLRGTLEHGKDVEIKPYSVLEDATIGDKAAIGPFSRLRPGAELAAETHVGNFVEIKKSTVGKGSKVNHLTYVGDTEIGENCNIGAGVITCNYDGANKFKTIIGNNVFVGSDTQLVAPVTIADGATIGAGSTITQNIEKDELVITRVPQRHIQGWQRPVKKK